MPKTKKAAKPQVAEETANLSWRDAIITVLQISKEPMHYEEIANIIVDSGLKKTANANFATAVNVELNRNRRNDFESLERGLYKLKKRAKPLTISKEVDTSVKQARDDIKMEGQENEKAIKTINKFIGAFGIRWAREKVEGINGSLLGIKERSKQDDNPVDFADQRGVYLLHNNEGVVYVGIVTDRAILTRLCEHTKNRLAGRWNSFSWFGFRKVDDDGTLSSPNMSKKEFTAEDTIVLVESLLIEILETGGNRRAGAGLQNCEYIQVTK